MKDNSLYKWYLVIAIRALAYTSGLYPAKIISSHFEQLEMGFLVQDLFFILLQIVLFEVVLKMVRNKYKPSFKRKNSTQQNNKKKLPALNKDDYKFRYQSEVYIYTSFGHVALQTSLAMLLSFNIVDFGFLIFNGAAFILTLLMHLLGVGILATKSDSLSKKIVTSFAVLPALVPGWVYVYAILSSV